MATRIINVLLRIALIAAIVASAVLFIDYSSAASASICGAGSSCAQVKASAFSHIGPVKLPLVGMVVFLGLFGVAVWARRRMHLKILTLQTGLVALGAAALIAIQLFVIKATCRWCMIVDVGAIVAFLLALGLLRREPD